MMRIELSSLRGVLRHLSVGPPRLAAARLVLVQGVYSYSRGSYTFPQPRTSQRAQRYAAPVAAARQKA